jgi:hypothetical protein
LTGNTFAAPDTLISRDRWGRPLIIPPGGGKPVAYTRASTLGKVLEEQSALTAWKQRMTLVGATLAPHIMVSVAAHRDDKAKLNELAEQAMAAAQAGSRAEIGTALHKLTETIDSGGDPGPYPAEFHADIEAYRRATAGWRYLAMETFVVCDELQVAGTFDRLRHFTVSDQPRQIVDLKTGSSVEYSGLSFAVQLAVYAHGSLYNPRTGERTPLGANQRTGLIVHLPAGEGRCDIYEVDIWEGWQAATTACEVRDMRKNARKWLRPATPTPTEAPAAEPEAPTPADLASWIPQAPTVEALTALWGQHSHLFDQALTDLATARHAELTAAGN